MCDIRLLKGIMMAQEWFFHRVLIGRGEPLGNEHKHGRNDNSSDEAADAYEHKSPNWKAVGDSGVGVGVEAPDSAGLRSKNDLRRKKLRVLNKDNVEALNRGIVIGVYFVERRSHRAVCDGVRHRTRGPQQQSLRRVSPTRKISELLAALSHAGLPEPADP
jgi:hypothetical protein